MPLLKTNVPDGVYTDAWDQYSTTKLTDLSMAFNAINSLTSIALSYLQITTSCILI
jgi:hypothetical protein